MLDATRTPSVRRPSAELAALLGQALCGDDAPDGLLICDSGWKVRFCNDAGARLLCLAQDAGDDLWSMQPELSGTTTELQLRSAEVGKASGAFVAPRPGAKDEWIEVRALPLGALTGFFLRDVTGQERTERHLRETNASLRMAHKAAKAATWEWRAGRSLRWTDPAAARRLVGLSSVWRADGAVEDWKAMLSPEALEAVEAGVADLVAHGEARFDFPLRGPDGLQRWLESSGHVTERNAAGRPSRITGITLDVTDRVATEQALRHEIEERQRAQSQQRLLIHELNHRVKNTLATVQSIAAQSQLGPGGKAGLELFNDRLRALGAAHDLLTRENWSGAAIAEIVQVTVAAHDTAGGARFKCAGPDIWLPPPMALALAMALHELATNAVKYGALSEPHGRVTVRWTFDPASGDLLLTWRERGGPPVAQPKRRGFGSRLIERGLSAALGGRARMAFETEGLTCEILATLAKDPPPQP